MGEAEAVSPRQGEHRSPHTLPAGVWLLDFPHEIKAFPEAGCEVAKGLSSRLTEQEAKAACGNFWEGFLTPTRPQGKQIPSSFDVSRTGCGVNTFVTHDKRRALG